MSNDDLFHQLDEEVEYAESWIAAKGDKLVGRVESIDVRDGGYGNYPIITLAVEAGSQDGKKLEVPCTRSFHAMAGIAKDELGFDKDTGRWTDNAVRIGDTVAAKYVEDRVSKSGHTYQYWRVIVKRQDLAADLDRDDLFTK